MTTINKDKVKKILVRELGYDDASAAVFLDDYPQIHDELSDVLEQWLQDRSIKGVDIYGLKIADVMKTKQYNFLLALKELNRLFDEDIASEQLEKLIKYFKEPNVRL